MDLNHIDNDEVSNLNSEEKKLFIKKLISFLIKEKLKKNLKYKKKHYWSKDFHFFVEGETWSGTKFAKDYRPNTQWTGDLVWNRISKGFVFQILDSSISIYLCDFYGEKRFLTLDMKYDIDMELSSIYHLTADDYNNHLSIKGFKLSKSEYTFLNRFNKYYNDSYKSIIDNRDKEIKKFQQTIPSMLKEFDHNGDGKLEIIELDDDLDKIIETNISKIIEIDKKHVLHFAQVSDYLKKNKNNLQLIFESILKQTNKKDVEESIELLREQIDAYKLFLFHSLNMIAAINNDDLYTFSKIYIAFDKLNIFNSNHQNELTQKLIDLNEELSSLIKSFNSFEKSMVKELNSLNLTIKSKFKDLSESLSNNLMAIDQSIQSNTLSINSAKDSLKQSLKNVNYSIGTNNLISFYNTFQNSITNRRLNS